MEYTIYTFSILRSTTPAFTALVPYLSAVLEGTDGSRFASIVEGYRDGMEIKIGMPVRCVGSDETGKKRYALA